MQLLLLFTVFPAYLVGHFFIKYDPGPPEPKKALEAAIGFGVLSVVLALIVSAAVSVLFTQDIEQIPASINATFILPIFIYASVEEFVKFIPLAIFVYKKSYFNENTDGIIYFAFVGLTFGAIESFLYAIGGGEFGVVVAIMRLVMGFFFHAAMTSYVGYYLARAKVMHVSMTRMYMALFFACIMHTLYNIGAFSTGDYPAMIFLSAFVAISMNVLMFWHFYKASEADVALGFRRPAPVIQTIQQVPSVVSRQPQAQQQAPQVPQQPHLPQQ